jgi:hypothetical protein
LAMSNLFLVNPAISRRNLECPAWGVADGTSKGSSI